MIFEERTYRTADGRVFKDQVYAKLWSAVGPVITAIMEMGFDNVAATKLVRSMADNPDFWKANLASVTKGIKAAKTAKLDLDINQVFEDIVPEHSPTPVVTQPVPVQPAPVPQVQQAALQPQFHGTPSQLDLNTDFANASRELSRIGGVIGEKPSPFLQDKGVASQMDQWGFDSNYQDIASMFNLRDPDRKVYWPAGGRMIEAVDPSRVAEYDAMAGYAVDEDTGARLSAPDTMPGEYDVVSAMQAYMRGQRG